MISKLMNVTGTGINHRYVTLKLCGVQSWRSHRDNTSVQYSDIVHKIRTHLLSDAQG